MCIGSGCDMEFALGELQNVQTELESYFGKDGTHVDLPKRVARLERAFRVFMRLAIHEGPHYATKCAQEILND